VLAAWKNIPTCNAPPPARHKTPKKDEALDAASVREILPHASSHHSAAIQQKMSQQGHAKLVQMNSRQQKTCLAQWHRKQDETLDATQKCSDARTKERPSIETPVSMESR